VLGISQWDLIVWPQYIGYICLLLVSMHTHTHTDFYIEFSRSMVMRQTYVVMGGMESTVIQKRRNSL